MAEDYVWIALYDIPSDQTNWVLVRKSRVAEIEARSVYGVSGTYIGKRGKFRTEPF